MDSSAEQAGGCLEHHPWRREWYPDSQGTRTQKKRDLHGQLGTELSRQELRLTGEILQWDPFPSPKYNLSFPAAWNTQFLIYNLGVTVPHLST